MPSWPTPARRRRSPAIRARTRPGQGRGDEIIGGNGNGGQAREQGFCTTEPRLKARAASSRYPAPGSKAKPAAPASPKAISTVPANPSAMPHAPTGAAVHGRNRKPNSAAKMGTVSTSTAAARSHAAHAVIEAELIGRAAQQAGEGQTRQVGPPRQRRTHQRAVGQAAAASPNCSARAPDAPAHIPPAQCASPETNLPTAAGPGPMRPARAYPRRRRRPGGRPRHRLS